MENTNFISVLKVFTVLWAMVAASSALFAILFPSANRWIVAVVVFAILGALLLILRSGSKQQLPGRSK